jgi:hypothetical protein
MVQARPPGGDRFRIASDMFDITRAMVIAGIRAEKPQIPESELRQELFLRYYGDEFSPEQRQKILAPIADYWRRKEVAQEARAWSWGGRGDRGDVSSNASWLDMTRRLLGRNVPSEAPLTP